MFGANLHYFIEAKRITLLHTGKSAVSHNVIFPCNFAIERKEGSKVPLSYLYWYKEIGTPHLSRQDLSVCSISLQMKWKTLQRGFDLKPGKFSGKICVSSW